MGHRQTLVEMLASGHAEPGATLAPQSASELEDRDADGLSVRSSRATHPSTPSLFNSKNAAQRGL